LKVSEKKVLTRIALPKREEVMGQRRKLHNEGLRNLCLQPNIVMVFKSRGDGRDVYHT